MANSPYTLHSITSPNSSEPITVKSATCKSLSVKSDLTYHLACDSNNEIYFRIAENSGGGFFSCEWITLSDIESEFENRPPMFGTTAFTLTQLFKSKSVNTPAFLLAVLKAFAHTGVPVSIPAPDTIKNLKASMRKRVEAFLFFISVLALKSPLLIAHIAIGCNFDIPKAA